MPGSDGGLSSSGGEPPPPNFEDVSPPPYSASSPDNDNNVPDSKTFFDPSSNLEHYVAVPSTSSSPPRRRHAGAGPRPRMLNFKVEYRDQNHFINVGDNEQIGKLFLSVIIVSYFGGTTLFTLMFVQIVLTIASHSICVQFKIFRESERTPVSKDWCAT